MWSVNSNLPEPDIRPANWLDCLTSIPDASISLKVQQSVETDPRNIGGE